MYIVKKINFVYITTNLINGKQYIGEHSTNDLECPKTKTYLGSGYFLILAIKKYGLINFKREILEFFPTKQDAYIAQEKYIKLYKTHISQGGYNRDWKGGCANKPLQTPTEETRLKQRNSHLGKPTGRKGKKFIEIFIKKYGEEEGLIKYNEMISIISNKLTGKKRTEESKIKQSKTITGKKCQKKLKKICEELKLKQEKKEK